MFNVSNCMESSKAQSSVLPVLLHKQFVGPTTDIAFLTKSLYTPFRHLGSQKDESHDLKVGSHDQDNVPSRELARFNTTHLF